MAEIKLPEKIEAGKPVEVQLAPRGTFPQIVDGEEVDQILDDDAIKALVSSFSDKVLVDADHDSETGRGTRAEAWVTKVWEDPEKGLMGTFEFTDVGADDVNNSRYRFISPAWTLDEAGRPVKLVSVGMTNKPNLPVAPVLNSRVACVLNSLTIPGGGENAVGTEGEGAKGTQTQNAASEGTPDGGAEQQDKETPKEGNPEMDEFVKKIKETLTLPDEATPEDVLAAIQALIARCGTTEAVNEALGLEPTSTNEETIEALNAVLGQCGELQAKNAAMEECARNEAADDFVGENADIAETPEEQDALREQFLADPEKAKETVANARRIAERVIANAKARQVAATRRVVNAQAAHRPEVVVNAQETSFEKGLAACNGDPEKENAFLANWRAK